MTTAPTQYEIQQAPKDGVTNVTFGKHSNRLVVSSWDKSVTLYDVPTADSNRVMARYEHQAAVLDAAFGNGDDVVFSGGVDKSLMMMDVHTNAITNLGQHREPIRAVGWSQDIGMVVSGSWDKSVSFWDPRQATPQFSNLPVVGKVYTIGLHGHNLVVGTDTRNVAIFDMRNPRKGPTQNRESSLKHQTRCIRCMIDGSGYVLSSTEGRVAVEYFDEQKNRGKYAFKCHRQTDKVANQTTVYPVNSIAFHPTFGTFATGGCDGIVNVWDGANKKRICQFQSYPTSIASMSFNRTGDYIAIAASYTWEQGELRNPPKDTIFIRPVRDYEVKPKTKKK